MIQSIGQLPKVLRYLQGSNDLSLVYRKTGKSLVAGFADADWAACPNDCRSYSGYSFLFAGAAVSWESKKQKATTLFTAEAEYVALTEAAKETIQLKQLMSDMALYNKNFQ